MSNHAGNNSATTSNDYGKECSVAGPSGEQQNVKKRKSEDLKKNFSTTPAKKVRQMTDRMTGAKKGATMKKETRKVTIQPKIVEISASEEEEEGDVTDMENQPECADERGNVATDTDKEKCAEAASPQREEMFAATQALQDEELDLEEEKRALTEKKKTEQRTRKIDNHPIAILLQELIPFADQGLAPLPRVIEEMRCTLCDPEFYSSLADPCQKDLLKIFRAWELRMKQLKRTGESLRSCGWKDIATLMLNDTFYTTFTRTELELPVKNALCDLWLNLDQEHIASHHTEDTSTSYTHVNTTIPPAGVTSPKSSGPASGSGWLERALAQETFHSKDGVLSQYICHTEHGSCLVLTTPGEIGYEVAKIELYPFTEVVNEDRLNWWRVARTRALVHFNSPLDPDLQQIKRILDRKAPQIAEMEGTEKKVTRMAADKSERKGPTRGNKS